jgi:hypothetical protein
MTGERASATTLSPLCAVSAGRGSWGITCSAYLRCAQLKRMPISCSTRSRIQPRGAEMPAKRAKDMPLKGNRKAVDRVRATS